MSDPRHNDQRAAMNLLTEQESSILAVFWKNSHVPIASIETSDSDENKPMCRTESSDTSWSTGGVSTDSGCFCSAGSTGEICTHAPLEEVFPSIPLASEDFQFPEFIPLSGELSQSFQNYQDFDPFQFGDMPALKPVHEPHFSLPESPDPSDCAYSREISEDSVETCWSSDQASSSSAVTEKKKHQLVVQLMARLQEWLVVTLRRHGARNGQSASSSSSTPVVTAASRSGESSNTQNWRKRRRSGSDDGFGEDDKTPDRTQKKRGKPSDAIETRYVCPFFKHNREKYKTSQWKSCCWPGWTSVHRVK
jgi:hypothetical protein